MATVPELADQAMSNAQDMADEADEVLEQMQESIYHLGYREVFFSGIVLPDAPEIPDDLVAPVVVPVNFDLPAAPGAAPAFQDISPIEVGAAPVLNATAPSITIPSAPAQLPGFNETLPAINTSFAFPEVPPELSNPLAQAPVIPDRQAPVKPTIALPSFDAVAPQMEAQAPANLDGQLLAAYNNTSPQFVAGINAQMDAWMTRYNPRYHQQLAAIEDKLAQYLAGGTGLSPTVEDAIYERSRTKQDAEARRSSDAAFDAMAARGFTVPGAAVLASLRQSRQAAADNNAVSAREIVVLQAEMEQKNLQWALGQSTALRQSMLSAALNYHGNLVAINGQAVQFAAAMVDMVVRVYNLQVEQFRARLDAYRTEAMVFDTRLKAAMSYVELYRAEIDALQAMVQVDQAKVSVYRTQMDALLTLAKVYEARVDVVVQQATLERLKLDVFRTQTEAYVATVQGKRAEYDAYQAAISGQEALVRVYGTQVQAFAAETQAYRARADAQGEVVRAQAMTNSSRGDNYRAQLAGYQTMVQASSEVARTKLAVNNQAFDAFRAQADATIATARLKNDNFKTRADVLVSSAQLEVNTLLDNAKNLTLTSRAIADVGVASAQVYQGFASSYVSGLNTLVAQTLAE